MGPSRKLDFTFWTVGSQFSPLSFGKVLEHRKRNRILTAGWVVTLVLAVFGPLGSRVFPAPFDGKVAIIGCFAVLLTVFALIPDRWRNLDRVLLASASALCFGVAIGLAIKSGSVLPGPLKFFGYGGAMLLGLGHRLFSRQLEANADGFDVASLPNGIAERYDIATLQQLQAQVAGMTEEDRQSTGAALKQYFADCEAELDRDQTLLRRQQAGWFLGSGVAIVVGVGVMFAAAAE